ncbi:MAG: hypothetical protein P4L40_18570 [Terracidiphilus sp.]|nr:hypothetical protein [Terracidiphilus sp.]
MTALLVCNLVCHILCCAEAAAAPAPSPPGPALPVNVGLPPSSSPTPFSDAAVERAVLKRCKEVVTDLNRAQKSSRDVRPVPASLRDLAADPILFRRVCSCVGVFLCVCVCMCL